MCLFTFTDFETVYDLARVTLEKNSTDSKQCKSTYKPHLLILLIN